MDILNTCVGNTGLLGKQLFDSWTENNCRQQFINFMTTVQGKLGYNVENLPDVQRLVTNLFINYMKTNNFTDFIESPEYNDFQYEILDFCNHPQLPGVCQQALNSFCQAQVSGITGSNIISNFCGCQNRDACDPLCHRIRTVQNADQGGNIIRCPDDICTISDITINLANSQVEGGINITNMCPNCSPSHPCKCIISSVNIQSSMSSIGLGIQFDQFCNKSSQCMEGGKLVDCKQGGTTTYTHYSWWIFIVVILVLALMLSLT